MLEIGCASGMCIMWEGVQRVVADVQGGKVLAVAACEESQSVASTSSNGSVHVWRVEYTSRSGGAPDRYTGIIGTPC